MNIKKKKKSVLDRKKNKKNLRKRKLRNLVLCLLLALHNLLDLSYSTSKRKLSSNKKFKNLKSKKKKENNRPKKKLKTKRSEKNVFLSNASLFARKNRTKERKS